MVTGLYRVLIEHQVTGATTEGQLARLSPYLSDELRDLLHAAATLRDVEAAAHPNEKPPFADGDLFSSLFEGPTSLIVLANGDDGDPRGHLAVQFTHDRSTPAVTWTDTLVIGQQAGRPVVADVIYGGTRDFATRGPLLETLRSALSE